MGGPKIKRTGAKEVLQRLCYCKEGLRRRTAAEVATTFMQLEGTHWGALPLPSLVVDI
jgi:hypothetical protein